MKQRAPGSGCVGTVQVVGAGRSCSSSSNATTITRYSLQMLLCACHVRELREKKIGRRGFSPTPIFLALVEFLCTESHMP